MGEQGTHLTDEEIIRAVDGGGKKTQARVHSHLASCWSCRARMRNAEETILRFVSARNDALDAMIPPSDGPRALLKAGIRQMSECGEEIRVSAFERWLKLPACSYAGIAGAICLAALSVLLVNELNRAESKGREAEISVPNRVLTPGATLLVDRERVCAMHEVNDRAVPVSVRHQVLAEYGIRGARPKRYEIDYLIAPALGGADDIHNLWPQSDNSPLWNAKAKDALEDRLRSLVCSGDLDLAMAQRDLSEDWIAAYKKYFHRESPLESRH